MDTIGLRISQQPRQRSLNPDWLTRWYNQWHTIVIVGLLIAAPLLIWGQSTNQSATLNGTWHNGFCASLLSGNFYPRWLDNSFNGYGSPSFYFYFPVPFYIS